MAEVDAVQGAAAAVQVLLAMTELLGVQEDNELAQQVVSRKAAGIAWDVYASSDDDDDDVVDDEEGCDFSSFPSLSLENSQSEPRSRKRTDVAEHVAHLLTRPILVSSNDEQQSKGATSDDDENLMEATLAQVPLLMRANLFKSFHTLVQSRLRTYARFLARHGLVQQQRMEQEGGAIEDKLEAIMELGALVNKVAVSTSFEPQLERTVSQPKEGEETESLDVCMPVVMAASLHLSVPNLVTNTQQHLSIPLRVKGTLTGIFAIAEQAESTTPLLRVVELNLNAHELVSVMARHASSVVNKIVDMANELCAFRQQLVLADPDQQELLLGMVHAVSQDLQELAACKKENPEEEGQEEEAIAAVDNPSPNKRSCPPVALVTDDEKALPLPVVSPTVGATYRKGSQPPSIPELSLPKAHSEPQDDDEMDGDETLPSPENCGKIVDYVFSGKNSPPPFKKARLDDPAVANAAWAVIPDLH